MGPIVYLIALLKSVFCYMVYVMYYTANGFKYSYPQLDWILAPCGLRESK